jgi:hypothetical protein
MGLYITSFYQHKDETKEETISEQKEINEKIKQNVSKDPYKDISNIHVIYAEEREREENVKNVILLSKNGNYIESSKSSLNIYNKELKLIKSYKNNKYGSMCLINEHLLVYNNECMDLIFVSINDLILKEIQVIKNAHKAKITKIIKGRNDKEIISVDRSCNIKFWNKNSNIFEISTEINGLNTDTYNDLLLISNILVNLYCGQLFCYDINNNNKLIKTFQIYKECYYSRKCLAIIDKKNKIFSLSYDDVYFFKVNDNNNIQLCTVIHLKNSTSVCLFMQKYILIANTQGNLFILNSKNYKLIKKAYVTHQDYRITELADNSFAAFGHGEIIFWKA